MSAALLVHDDVESVYDDDEYHGYSPVKLACLVHMG